MAATSPSETPGSSAPATASLSERLYDRLHGAMAFLGALFLGVVVSERLVEPNEPMRSILVAIGWATWAVFVAEFGLRFALAADRRVFIRRYWWQALLLLLPFLNIVRALAAARVTRVGRALSAGVRGSASARTRLTGRLGWLTSSTIIVIIVAADVLYQFGDYSTYAESLRDAALGTLTGEPTKVDTGLAQTLDIFLAAFSVVVVGSVAAALGAFFLDDDRKKATSADAQGTSRR